jgi:hypothetical protein
MPMVRVRPETKAMLKRIAASRGWTFTQAADVAAGVLAEQYIVQSEPRKNVENGKAVESASSDCSTCSQSMS